ncbi:unnamed protein product [Lactuca saligna]|uniref:Uncharacterized protein n=1 Tax=Lactuca saligna TaxID=75948 RepID=A0AA35ZWE5_LACSI|nr:unnamed protein product [Lactuca saligna]
MIFHWQSPIPVPSIDKMLTISDVYLAGTVMLIFAVGLYGLFINNAPDSIAPEDDRAIKGSSLFGMFALRERPKWMKISSLGELKTKVATPFSGFVGRIHQELYTMNIGKQSIAHLVCKEGLLGIGLTRGSSRKMQMVANTGHMEVTLEIH